MLRIIFTIFFVLNVIDVKSVNIEAELEFTNYYKKFNKHYNSISEYVLRKQIFMETLEKIKQIN